MTWEKRRKETNKVAVNVSPIDKCRAFPDWSVTIPTNRVNSTANIDFVIVVLTHSATRANNLKVLSFGALLYVMDDNDNVHLHVCVCVYKYKQMTLQKCGTSSHNAYRHCIIAGRRRPFPTSFLSFLVKEILKITMCFLR